jgi:nitroreductase
MAALVDETGVQPSTPPVLDAIRTRRSIPKVGPERPPQELIERLIEAATWAPNHHLTEPWRFFVVAGEARRELGEVMARALNGEPKADAERTAFALAAAKPLRAPVVIAVAVEPASGSQVYEVEEISAGAAATQNLLLAAHALGLGAMWRTGEAAYHPAVKAFFGLEPAAHLLGFVYVGYPAAAPPLRERKPAASLTTWLGWDGDAAAIDRDATQEEVR